MLWPAVAFQFTPVNTTAEADRCSDFDIRDEHTSSASRTAIQGYVSMSIPPPMQLQRFCCAPVMQLVLAGLDGEVQYVAAGAGVQCRAFRCCMSSM